MAVYLRVWIFCHFGYLPCYGASLPGKTPTHGMIQNHGGWDFGNLIASITMLFTPYLRVFLGLYKIWNEDVYKVLLTVFITWRDWWVACGLWRSWRRHTKDMGVIALVHKPQHRLLSQLLPTSFVDFTYVWKDIPLVAHALVIQLTHYCSYCIIASIGIQ